MECIIYFAAHFTVARRHREIYQHVLVKRMNVAVAIQINNTQHVKCKTM